MQKSKIKRAEKVVLVGGCFDILHYGHICFLKEAKKLGDYLVVLLESDENTKRLKGPTRPIHTQKQRREILESLEFIDKVIELKGIMRDVDYAEIVAKIGPHIIAVTEGDTAIGKKKMHAKKVRAKLVKIKNIKTRSTTQIAKLLKLE